MPNQTYIFRTINAIDPTMAEQIYLTYDNVGNAFIARESVSSLNSDTKKYYSFGDITNLTIQNNTLNYNTTTQGFSYFYVPANNVEGITHLGVANATLTCDCAAANTWVMNACDVEVTPDGNNHQVCVSCAAGNCQAGCQTHINFQGGGGFAYNGNNSIVSSGLSFSAVTATLQPPFFKPYSSYTYYGNDENFQGMAIVINYDAFGNANT